MSFSVMNPPPQKNFFRPTSTKYRLIWFSVCKQTFKMFPNHDDITPVSGRNSPISQQHSFLFDRCWLFPSCLWVPLVCADIFTTVVEVFWSVPGSLKLRDFFPSFWDKEESLHSSLSAVPSGKHKSCLCSLTLAEFLLSSLCHVGNW